MTDDTPKFVLDFILGSSINEEWKDWAYSNFIAGYELDSLMSLIVLHYPADQFEAKQIVNQVFDDLQIDVLNVNLWICKYVEQIERKIEYKSFSEVVLKLSDLKELYLDSNFEFGSIKEFYLLYYGISDLEDAGVQWYHNKLTKNNMREIVSLAFENFKIKNCKSL